MRDWIFQANPKIYDAAGAVKALPEQVWLVRQYRNQIKAGDRAFIWETGPESGIVAVASILTDPEIIPENREADKFDREPTTLTGDQLRVRIRIDRVVEPRLLRAVIEMDPVGQTLPNLKFANATNFPVKPEQAAVLDRLLGGPAPASGVGVPPGLEAADFDVLARNTSLPNFGTLSEADRSQVRALRSRLLAYATSLAKDIPAAVPLRAFASHPNPSGRISRIYWSCAFPASVRDKSYAFQLIIIVRAEHVEIGFGSGAARSPFRKAPTPSEDIAALAQARTSLDELVGTDVLERAGDAVSAAGFKFREAWDRNPTGGGMATIDEWAKHAGSETGGSAVISRFLTRDEALALGDDFYPTVRRELTAFAPLMSAIYGSSAEDGVALADDLPPEFRMDLFEAAVLADRAEYDTHADPRPEACRQLQAWLAGRALLSDEEVWTGLRERYLRFGVVVVDGRSYGPTDSIEMTQAEFDAAAAAGRVDVQGNLHWTNLARSAGRSKDDIPAVRRAIDVLLDESRPYEDRLAAVIRGDSRVPGFQMAHWTGLYAMATDWAQPAFNGTVDRAFELLGWPLSKWEAGQRVAEVRERGSRLLAHAGLESFDRLDRIYWGITRLPEAAATPAVATAPEAAKRPTLGELATQLCLEFGYLEDVDWLLADRKQLVFYGPPGTGKTYVAEKLAAWFAGSDDRTTTIQFHPSYAYEDFVEGIRPVLGQGDVGYELTPGLLRQFAERAEEDRERRYVLVIDEINRANLARVFGELLYLLEYRDRDVLLPYSQERFSLPENLYLIGTMNTADRSIALVDFALRRRFHFIHFAADAEILRRWLTKSNPAMREVAELLAWVNQEIGDHDFAIGFSYFMRKDLDEALLQRIWQHSVLPALDEFYFNDADKRRSFELARVRAAIAAAVRSRETTDVAEPGSGAEVAGEVAPDGDPS